VKVSLPFGAHFSDPPRERSAKHSNNRRRRPSLATLRVIIVFFNPTQPTLARSDFITRAVNRSIPSCNSTGVRDGETPRCWSWRTGVVLV
jgi:hypothetical protein